MLSVLEFPFNPPFSNKKPRPPNPHKRVQCCKNHQETFTRFYSKRIDNERHYWQRDQFLNNQTSKKEKNKKSCKLKSLSQRAMKRKTVLGIDYRCDDGCFRLSAHNCQIPTQTSQNLEIEQQNWVFWNCKVKNYLFFMLELLRQGQTNSLIFWKIESHNS